MKTLFCCAAVAVLTACQPLSAGAQNGERPAAVQVGPRGSASFCLYELPTRDGATRFINLGIAQYVELNRERVRITYGGGNFGSGYDADIAVGSREEGLELIRRIQQTARECARYTGMGGPDGMGGMGMRGMGRPNGGVPEPAQPQNAPR